MDRKAFNLWAVLLLLAVLLVSGCIDVAVTQNLGSDPTADQELVVVVKTDSESYIRDVNDAIKRINCTFSSQETREDGTIRITYTSSNCLVDRNYVNHEEIGDGKLKYSFNSTIWGQEGLNSVTDKKIFVNVDGRVSETNGIQLDHDSVKFLISSSDIDEGHVYYVIYTSKCAVDSDCLYNETCVNSRCTPLICDYCEHIKDYICVKYDCCNNSECSETMHCSNHTCVDVAPLSECGTTSNHMWVGYQCCSNKDCPYNQYCIDHQCQKLECSFLEKIDNHGCAINFTTIGISIGTVLLIILAILVLFYMN